MTIDDATEQRLKALTRENAKNWIEIGRALTELETQSRSAPSGKAWPDVIRERLAELNAPVSPGHIYKIRRAYSFLLEHAPWALTPESPKQPKISSIEIAERLHRLDAEAGQNALEDALAPEPASYIELKERYDQALEATPEMKSPRQIAWEGRRKTEKLPSKEGPEKTTYPASDAPAKAFATADQKASGPSIKTRRKIDELLSQTWTDGWRAAEKQYMVEIDSLRSIIASQADTLAQNADELQEQRDEIDVLAKKVRELQKYYPEDI